MARRSWGVLVLLAAGLSGCDGWPLFETQCHSEQPCEVGVCREGACVSVSSSMTGCGDPCEPAGTPGGYVYGGDSVCQQGTWNCNADAGGKVCEGFVGAAEGGEVCNGLDDDCDGEVDEIEPEPCMPDADGDGAPDFVVGADNDCAPGRSACLDGMTVCDDAMGPLPGEADDDCDGRDDDCDGMADEGWVEVACYENADGEMLDPRFDGIGTCRAGTLRCTPNGPDCQDLAVPADQDFCGGRNEDCDCNDEPRDGDCDEKVDEDGEAPEVCDGEDNDCDGMIDDGLPTTPETAGDPPCHVADGNAFDPMLAGVGACVAGRSYCVDGGSMCVGAVGPVDETCNEVDDDCDGAVDEDFDVGGPCTVGRGACLADGALVCNLDTENPVDLRCDAVPGMPAPEVCNALHDDAADDDCDGMVDEGCACNARLPGDGGPALLPDVTMAFQSYTLPPLEDLELDPSGLFGSCTGQAADAARDELALVWNPRPGEIRRIEVTSARFDPRAYLRGLCRAGAASMLSEVACGLDAGLSLAPLADMPGPGERAVSMVVRVPDADAEPPPPAEVGVFVEAQDGRDGGFEVSISDPTRSAACMKQLWVRGEGEGADGLSGEARCRKRLWDPLLQAMSGSLFTLIAPGDGVAVGRWDDPRFCVDNDGRARSVEVGWELITADAGVEAMMMPDTAERGDWWSTVVSADAEEIRIFVEPVEADAPAACLAHSVRLVAYLTCTRAVGMEQMRAQTCQPVGANEVLACQDDSQFRLSCVDVLGDGRVLPRRNLNLLDLDDRGCRADGGELVLHIGVIRARDPAPPDCGVCAGADRFVADDACFRYRLRVRD